MKSKKEYIKDLKKDHIYKPLKKLAKIAKTTVPQCITKSEDGFDWDYNKHSWTGKQEEKYRRWLKRYIKRKYKYLSERKIDFEAGMIILYYGWRGK